MSDDHQLPNLCGVTEVAEILGITRQNVPNARKAKAFPKPAGLIGGKRPVWFEKDILAYKQFRESRKKAKGGFVP